MNVLQKTISKFYLEPRRKYRFPTSVQQNPMIPRHLVFKPNTKKEINPRSTNMAYQTDLATRAHINTFNNCKEDKIKNI